MAGSRAARSLLFSVGFRAFWRAAPIAKASRLIRAPKDWIAFARAKKHGKTQGLPASSKHLPGTPLKACIFHVFSFFSQQRVLESTQSHQKHVEFSTCSPTTPARNRARPGRVEPCLLSRFPQHDPRQCPRCGHRGYANPFFKQMRPNTFSPLAARFPHRVNRNRRELTRGGSAAGGAALINLQFPG